MIITAVVLAVSSGSVTINEDSSVQILAEEACSVDQLDAQVGNIHCNLATMCLTRARLQLLCRCSLLS